VGRDEDRKLFEACLAGLPGAWEAFVTRFSPYLAEVPRPKLNAWKGRVSVALEAGALSPC
jgi:hypothetical protein